MKLKECAYFCRKKIKENEIQNPVEGCGRESFHPKSFWHLWGDHNHRGIDIFAKKGTPVHPAIGGVVISTTHD